MSQKVFNICLCILVFTQVQVYAYLLDTKPGDTKREDPQSSLHYVKLLFLLQSFSKHENV